MDHSFWTCGYEGSVERMFFRNMLDFLGMLACVSKEEFVDFTLKIVETSLQLMRKKSIQSGKPSSQHVFIFDLEGFSLKVNMIVQRKQITKW